MAKSKRPRADRFVARHGRDDDAPDSKLSRALGWLVKTLLLVGMWALLLAIPADSQHSFAPSTEVKLVAVGSGLILVGLLPALYMAYRRRKGVALNESGNEGSRPRSGSEPGQIVVPDDGPAQDAPEPFSTSNPLPPAAKTWFIAVFAGITVLLLATAVACLVVGNPNGAELAAFFAILTALMLSLCVLARVRPPRVEVSDTGIVVVDPFRTRRIRWHDLRRVEYVDVKRDSGPTTRLCFFKTSGRRVLVDESAAPPYSDRGVFRDRVLAYRDYMLRKENGGLGRADPPRPDE